MARDDEACMIMCGERIAKLLTAHPEAESAHHLLAEFYQRAWKDSQWWFAGQLLVTGKKED